MILNSSGYNPLEELLQYDLSNITVDMLNLVQHELHKAGILPETIQEFDKVLGLLIETQREYYGKK